MSKRIQSRIVDQPAIAAPFPAFASRGMSRSDIAEARAIDADQNATPEQVYTALRLCCIEPQQDRFEHLIDAQQARITIAAALCNQPIQLPSHEQAMS